MTTIEAFIAKHRISADVEWASTNPNIAADDKWMAQAHHFKVTLHCGRKQMTVPFSQGCLVEREPTAADVLDCLASDASGVENAGCFEDWCAEYGYDTDSRKAEKTYNVCDAQRERLWTLLGDEAFDELLCKVERL